MRLFHGAREAKEFLISKIVLEAEREGVALSEVERKMLYFSETNWTLPDIQQIHDEFSSTCDQDDYEAKVVRLVRRAYRGLSKQSRDEYDKWWSAVHFLSKQDHYVSVMISQANLKPRLINSSCSARGLLSQRCFCAATCWSGGMESISGVTSRQGRLLSFTCGWLACPLQLAISSCGRF